MAKNLRTDAQKNGYALGLDFGATLKHLPVTFDFSTFLDALNDIYKSQPLSMGQDEWKQRMEQIHNRLQEESRKQQEESRKQQEAAGGNNAQAGDAYRTEHAQKDGVSATDSGILYEVIAEGDGAQPKATDTVKVHYVGQLIDGTEFDSSVARGTPATFPLNRVIPGWTEGLQLMKVGAKYRFVLPPALAYGAQGAPPNIGPNSTLIFDVELLGIE